MPIARSLGSNHSVNTFSMAALDTKNGDLGVVVGSRVLAVGAGTPYAKPESTEGGRLVSILKWPEGAPLNLG